MAQNTNKTIVYVCQEEWYDDNSHGVNEPVVFATLRGAHKWRDNGIASAIDVQGIKDLFTDTSKEGWHRTMDGFYQGKPGFENIWYHWNITQCELSEVED